MPELRSCYFCGTADEVTEYAVVPPRFADSETDQRSAVLCERCRDKLMRVVEPLAEKLDAAEGRSDGATAGGTGDPDASTGTGPSASAASPAEEAARPADDGIVINPGASTAGTDAAGADEGGRTESRTDARPDLDAESPAGEAAREDTDDSPPPNYRQAMRLLSNREFPMERYDVEELLAGAYELENEEVAAVLAYAAESGRLEDDDGTLRRA